VKTPVSTDHVASHTPGPWWTDAAYDGKEMGCSIIAARTDCGPLPGNPTRGQVAYATAILNTQARECEANARLIAAAPDLLALAKQYASECAGCDGTGYISSWEKCADCADIRAVIAKAEGRS
jgi:hypothetical protein